jgi:hypothetical protein
MRLRSAFVLAMLVGCWAGSSTPTPMPGNEWVEPTVDMTCVIRGEQGTLLTGLPQHVAGFAVTKTAHGVHLHRDGREMSDSEASALWHAGSAEWLAKGGLAMADSGLESSYFRCDDIGPGGCFKLEAWICQRSLEDLAADFAAAAAEKGAGDAAASLDIEYIEAHGPRCKHGVDCAPIPHDPHRDTYDPMRPRIDRHDGRGVCRNDGDCDATQTCRAWYLDGGFEPSGSTIYSMPVFCGCIAHRCTWFEQP